MNSLFNTALKQSTALRRDLDTFSSHTSSAIPPPASLSGQISASLTSFTRTLDDYANLTKSELNDTKKEKALERLKNFRHDLQSFRDEFSALKRDAADATATSNRAELLGRRPHAAATPENPYARASDPSKSVFAPSSSSPYASANGAPAPLGFGTSDPTREAHALREQNFFASTNATLDEYLDRGRAVLGDLGQQKEVLKSTQRRLYSVGNTLGISGDTIRMVERRAKQDKWIFWGGVVVFFGFCWLVIHFLK